MTSTKPTITYHGDGDWCHLCGKRVPTADVWYPDNAEHQDHNTQYIRICGSCAQTITATIESRSR